MSTHVRPHVRRAPRDEFLVSDDPGVFPEKEERQMAEANELLERAQKADRVLHNRQTRQILEKAILARQRAYVNLMMEE